MPFTSDPFALKIEQLEDLVQQLIYCLSLCPLKSQTKLDQEILTLHQTCRQEERRLAECAAHSQLPAAGHLAQAQLDYLQETAVILTELIAPTCTTGTLSTMQEQDQHLETLLLYAEYAIDFAALSVRHALLAALTAASAQADDYLTKEPTP